MKKGIFICVFVFFSLNLHARPATDADIKIVLREMDKRFEQVDKRFEQLDKRFEFIQMLIIAMLAAVIGSPLLVDYLARKRETASRLSMEKSDKLLIVLRELAQKDPKVEKAMRIAGLS